MDVQRSGGRCVGGCSCVCMRMFRVPVPQPLESPYHSRYKVLHTVGANNDGVLVSRLTQKLRCKIIHARLARPTRHLHPRPRLRARLGDTADNIQHAILHNRGHVLGHLLGTHALPGGNLEW